MIFLDWRNPNDYAFTQDLDKSGWAWEFLRRSERYQDDYRLVREIYAEGEAKYGPFKDNEPKWRKFKKAVVDQPFTELGDRYGAWNGRIWEKNTAPESIYLEQHVAGTWGLKDELADPACDDVPTFRYPYNHPRYMVEDSVQEYLIERSSIGNKETSTSKLIAIGFDLSLPIDKQIEKASDILLSQREHRRIKERISNRAIPHIWLTYLRLLDAEHELGGFKRPGDNKELIAVVSPNESEEIDKHRRQYLADRIRRQLKQAKRMSDIGYISITRSKYHS